MINSLLNSEPVQVEVVSNTQRGDWLIALFALAVRAWTVMLLVGYLHSRHHAIPTVSWWETVAALVVVSTVVPDRRRAWIRRRASR